MRWLLLTVCGGLVLAGAVVAATATSPRRLAAAPAASSMALTADQAALGRSIRAYLMANPEVLVDAMQELERKQDSQRDAVAQKGVQENQTELYRDPDSPVGGNPDGDVVIVEFNDYQCPYCKRAYQAVKSVAGSDGKVKIVYKDIPILGEASKIAALAALASVKQGKDMEDPKLKAIIDRNMALASALGVRGTPAFVIGKQFVPGAVDAAALKQLIADARKGQG